jgi:4-hydroxybenzoate polyprenyltransferase
MATERLLIGRIPPLFTALHVLVFGSTLLVYNTHYLIKKSTPQISDRFAWSQHYKLWHYIIFGIGVLCCIISVFYVNQRILLGCGVLAILSFAYSLPMLPFKNKKRLKDFGWIKILVLTTVWTIVTSVLPMLFWKRSLSDYPFEILIRFVFLFTLCIAFDIRDMQTDLDANIFTLPNRIGLQNSYRLINATIVLFALLCIAQYIRYPSITRLAGEMVTAIVTKLVIDHTKRHPSDRVYLGLVDGMMLLYALLVLVH